MSEPKLTSNNFENHCGHTVSANMKFCPECGAEIKPPVSKEEKVKELESENEELKLKVQELEEKIKNSGTKIAFRLTGNSSSKDPVGITEDGKLYWKIVDNSKK